MIGRVRESRNPKKVIRVALMESYGEIRRVPVNLFIKNTSISAENNGFIKNIMKSIFSFIDKPINYVSVL